MLDKHLQQYGEVCLEKFDWPLDASGKLSLNTLVRRDQPVRVGEHQEVTVSYTYRFKAAPWTRDPDLRRVFPVVQRLIDGAGTIELKPRLRGTKNTWVGVNLWE